MHESNRDTHLGERFPEGRARLLILCALGLAVFCPALNNGFISDDYVALDRANQLLDHPLLLYGIPPENFRSTMYLVFLFLKTLVGYHAWVFYLFTLGLHVANAWLLGRLTGLLWENPDLGFLTSIFFLTFQNPLEAFFWLAAMHEVLLGFLVLATLLCWVERRWRWSLAAYCGALFSKESGVAAVGLLPLADFWRLGRLRWRQKWAYFAIPTALFAILFLALSASNSLLQADLYAFSPQALEVLLRSLNRIAWPWIYLLAAAFWLDRRHRQPAPLTAPLLWMAVSLLPYIFLTYQNHVPSRHQYLASMGAAAVLAALLASLSSRRVRRLLLLSFVVVNAGYVYWVKDRQFEERAAPTNQLVAYLRTHPPAPVRLVGYPFNPWTAKLTTRLVPGWSPELIVVDDNGAACPGCPELRWDAKLLAYQP